MKKIHGVAGAAFAGLLLISGVPGTAAHAQGMSDDAQSYLAILKKQHPDFRDVCKSLRNNGKRHAMLVDASTEFKSMNSDAVHDMIRKASQEVLVEVRGRCRSGKRTW